MRERGRRERERERVKKRDREIERKYIFTLTEVPDVNSVDHLRDYTVCPEEEIVRNLIITRLFRYISELLLESLIKTCMIYFILNMLWQFRW